MEENDVLEFLQMMENKEAWDNLEPDEQMKLIVNFIDKYWDDIDIDDRYALQAFLDNVKKSKEESKVEEIETDE